MTWDGEGDDALVETDEEEEVLVLGDPSLLAAGSDKVTALAFGTAWMIPDPPVSVLENVRHTIWAAVPGTRIIGSP